MKSKTPLHSTHFVATKRNPWAPDIEVRQTDSSNTLGVLEAIFLGSEAEAAAQAWIRAHEASQLKEAKKAQSKQRVSRQHSRTVGSG